MGGILVNQREVVVEPGETALVEVRPSDLPEHSKEVGTLFAEVHGDGVPLATQAVRGTTVPTFAPIKHDQSPPN